MTAPTPSVKDRRRPAPFGRRRAAVIDNQRVGAYRLVRCEDTTGPPPRPGQFYMLAAVERWGAGVAERPFLPRAFSVMRAAAGRLEFLLEDVGPGTRRLAELRPGEELWITGPLGLGFTAPAGSRRPVHVGGGIGIAPLVIWQEELGAGSALLGFRDREHAAAAALLRDVRLATDDGSEGAAALVTDLLEDELDSEEMLAVYACGPPGMLEAVRVSCARRGVPAQLAMEVGMACGYGACFGCAVATRNGYVRLCLDGPVLDAADLDSALVSGAGH
ncbi:MAG: dihydroorotate dehydrogenase electron transfer subunit [Actinomycetota bacterium]|nr:dihydroorotate dehydrogenase electron transfer subunit [Actinomycetota bacterium]